MKTVGGVVAGLVIGAAVGATAFPSREYSNNNDNGHADDDG